MKYALISTKEHPLKVFVPPKGNPIAKDGTYEPAYMDDRIAPIGTIVNLIVYDGKAEYTPPDGMRVALVPDDAQIGDIGYEEKQE